MNGAATVGFVGLGNMGQPMTARLREAGFRVPGFDVSDAARQRFAEQGGESVSTAAGAARDADAVILMLPDSNVVESVAGEPAFREAMRPGAVLVDMSSSEPMRTRALAERLATQGIPLVDAPVSGGVSRARAGTLTIMAGGDTDVVERIDPLLRPLGTPVHVGPVGAGHATKALNNLLSATHLLATAEAMLAGERFGLDPEVLLSVINTSSGRSGSTENKWPNFILTEKYDSGFGLRLMLKDMRIAVGLSEQVGAAGRLGRDAVRLWAEAAEALPVNADHTEVARWVRAFAEKADRTRPREGGYT